MHFIIGALLTISALDYLFLIIMLYIGLSKVRNPQKISIGSSLKISIIICGRNEEKNIPALAESLEKLDYPKDLFEVILVNDASTDKTLSLMQQYAQRNENWKVIDIKEKSKKLKGKKYALTEGINQAENDIILLTDADCIVQENWLNRIVRSYTGDTGIVIGFSPSITDDTFTGRIDDFVNMCNAIVSAGAAGCGHPYSCVGRNLSFRKELFHKVGGFTSVSQYSSGDDMLLLRLITGQTSFVANCCISPDSYTFTKPVKKNNLYIHQQRRRMGKTFLLPRKFIIHTGMIFVYLIILLLIFFLFPYFRTSALISLVTIAAAQVGLFIFGAIIFRRQYLIKLLPVMLIIFPLHSLFFSIWGNINRGSWKQ